MLAQFLLTGGLLLLAGWIGMKTIVHPFLEFLKTKVSKREKELRGLIKELESKRRELEVSQELLALKTIDNELSEKQKELDELLEGKK